jgi:NADH-quinone oxidoreductase subunit J
MLNIAPMDLGLSIFSAVFAILVVTNKNPIIAAFSLLVTFMGFGGIYFRLGTVFLTTIQILVYAGAIAILFIFVLMLMNLSGPEVRSPKRNYNFAVGLICLVIFLGIMTLIIFDNAGYLESDKLPVVPMNTLFDQLFSKYLVPFELATMLLLGVTAAVVFISKRYDESEGARE